MPNTVFDKALHSARQQGFIDCSSGDDVLVTVFEDGLSHQTALFQNKQEHYVVKVLKGERQILSQAITGQKIAATMAIAPQVLFSNIEQGILISEYLGGTSIANTASKNASTQESLFAIAGALKTLHNSPINEAGISLGQFDLIRFCEGYLRDADQASLAQHEVLLPVLQRFQTHPHKVLCHNDLVAENIFLQTNSRNELTEAKFIDWEYCQINNPWFDLAAIVFYLNLSQAKCTAFLDAYFDDTPYSNKDLRDACAALLWGDILWHLHKFGDDFKPRLTHKFAWLKANVSGFHLDA